MGDYENIGRGDLILAGVAYAPGDRIPAAVDPAQLAHFAQIGVVRLADATGPTPVLVDVSEAESVAPSVEERRHLS